MRIRTRVISILMIVLILTGVLPTTNVKAANANFMSAKMIKFFQDGSDINMDEISESELQVYGVFLSNFFTPGTTLVSDLQGETEAGQQFAKDIAKTFLGSSDRYQKVIELNKLVFKAATESYTDKPLTTFGGDKISGADFLRAMAKTGDDAKVKQNDKIVVDYENEAFKGAFKILAAYSAEYILDKEFGVWAMSSLYMDCFGNIWGAYPYTHTVGSVSRTEETESTKLNLVLPACLNPLSFYNTGGKSATMDDLKIPLNNAFAMGALIRGNDISTSFTTDNKLIATYNLGNYFKEIKDKDNSLSIYGINSSTNFFNNTNSIYWCEYKQTSEGTVKLTGDELNNSMGKLKSDLTTQLDNFYKANGGYRNVNNYKIVLSNRVDYFEKLFKEQKGDWLAGNDTYFTGITQYLYGSMTAHINKTYSDIYYFGESTESWAKTEFNKLGMVGINMFGSLQDDGSWYVHDENLKTPLFTELVKDNVNTYDTVIKLRNLIDSKDTLEIPYSYPDIYLKYNAGNKLITFLDMGDKDYYIPSVNPDYDSVVLKDLSKVITTVKGSDIYGYGSELSIALNSSLKNFSTDETKVALLHTLHNYTVSGAKYNGDKVRESTITVLKPDGKTKPLDITNSRVSPDTNWPGIFWGYMVEILDMKAMMKIDSDGNPNYDIRYFESAYLPKLPSSIVKGSKLNLTPLDSESGVANSSKLSMEETQKDLIKKIYGIVSDKPNTYRDNWIKSMIDGFIINTHKHITGSKLANIATVSSEDPVSYTSVVGYIHTPSLYDLPFTSWIMNNYMEIYIISLLIVMVFIILMVLLNMRTWKQGVMIFLIMTVSLLLPNILIENTINIGNKVADNIYSDRFDFWALTQHQQSYNKLKGATDKSSMEFIVANTDIQTKNIYKQEAGVRVKWMAPKKSGVFANLFNNKYISDKLSENLNIYKFFFSSFVYQQEFVSNDAFATYLYRPYNSIAADAKEYYDLAKGKLVSDSTNRLTTSISFTSNKKGEQTHTVSVDKSLVSVLSKLNTEYSKKYKEGLYGRAVWGNKELLKTDNVFRVYWGEDKFKDVTEIASGYPNLTGSNTLDKNSVSLWGLGNSNVLNVIVTDGVLGNKGGPSTIPNLPSNFNNVDTETVELLGYYKNTESPYYYFYNVLKYRYGDTASFKNSLLRRDNWVVDKGILTSSSKNVSNKVRDFLDLEGLFTNIIPYMSMSNDYVYGWTSVYGTEVPEYTFTDAGDTDLNGDVRDTYKELRTLKEGMERVWNMYCPWVDQLNSLDIKNEKVGIGGKRVKVENILNPSYYLKAGRPMIFSEADMIAKGYKESDLSDIEKRIQRVLDTTYKDLQYLVNYYDMDDEVLITAAAMYATFNFNREFSQNNILGESVTLYPQGFEMKNFNYDAFMQLVMLNSTGETVFASGDLYERVLNRTSSFTGLMLLITDILGVILIPTMKLIILLMLLFLGVLLCMTCVVSPPEKLLQAVSKSLLLPALLFLLSNIVFALLISFLVGEGLTSYVGARNISISTEDPTITIGIMILINSIYCVALFKVIKMLLSSYKTFGLNTIQTGLGLVAGVGLAGISAAKKALNKTGAGVGYVGNSTSTLVSNAMASKGNKLKGTVPRSNGVYNPNKNGQKIAEDKSKSRDLADEINMKASGITKESDKSTNQTKEPINLKKEDYTKDGTTLGNRFEDIVYVKNKVQDKVSETKHNLNNRKTDIINRVGQGFENTKKKLKENMDQTQIKVKRVKKTAGDILTGKYFDDSIKQGAEKDKLYRARRNQLDLKRGEESSKTKDIIDKMTNKK